MNSSKSAEIRIGSSKEQSLFDMTNKMFERADTTSNTALLPEMDETVAPNHYLELPSVEPLTKMLLKSQSYY